MRVFAEALVIEAFVIEADTFSLVLTGHAPNARRMKAAPHVVARRGPPITAIDKDERR